MLVAAEAEVLLLLLVAPPFRTSGPNTRSLMLVGVAELTRAHDGAASCASPALLRAPDVAPDASSAGGGCAVSGVAGILQDEAGKVVSAQA